MTKEQYEIEEASGGYVRVGDVLEWRDKGAASVAPSPVTTEDAPKPKPRKKTAAKKGVK